MVNRCPWRSLRYNRSEQRKHDHLKRGGGGGGLFGHDSTRLHASLPLGWLLLRVNPRSLTVLALRACTSINSRQPQKYKTNTTCRCCRTSFPTHPWLFPVQGSIRSSWIQQNAVQLSLDCRTLFAYDSWFLGV